MNGCDRFLLSCGAVLAVICLLALAVSGAPVRAGGYCPPHVPGCGADSRDTATGPIGAAPPVASPVGPGIDAGAVARAAYRDRLTDLWRSEANGTCLGVLGAWHLTPKRIIAEGIVYELLTFSGSAAQIEIGARRVADGAPSFFTLVPLGRSRLDIVGTVRLDAPELDSAYDVALRRC